VAEPYLRIEATTDGAALRLGTAERRLLGDLLDQLETAIESEDATTVRLFPPAHADDADAEAGYRSMVHEDLVDGRRAHIATVRSTLDASELDAAQVTSWLHVANDLRLVMGTELGITAETQDDPPDDDDPRYPSWVAYLYLTWLESQLIDVLAARL
jgi:uncharacterized protein DUF2017